MLAIASWVPWKAPAASKRRSVATAMLPARRATVFRSAAAAAASVGRSPGAASGAGSNIRHALGARWGPAPAVLPCSSAHASSRSLRTFAPAQLPRSRRKGRFASSRRGQEQEEGEEDDGDDADHDEGGSHEDHVTLDSPDVRSRILVIRKNPPSPFQPISTEADQPASQNHLESEQREGKSLGESRRAHAKNTNTAPDSNATESSSRLRGSDRKTPAEESSAPSGDGDGAPGSDGATGGDGSGPPPPSAPAIPEVYPQVLALPITGRPLFPDHRKVVVVTDPKAMAAIDKVVKSDQPWVGAFLLKDDTIDTDIVTSPDQVHQVGVFCRIVSTWHLRANPSKTPSDAKSAPEGDKLSVLLVPVRRISIEDVFNPNTVSLPPAPASTDPAPASAPSSSSAPQESDLNNKSEAVSSLTEQELKVKKMSPAEAQALEYTQSVDPAQVSSSVESETETAVEEVHPRQAETSQTRLLQDLDVSMVQVHNYVLEPYELTTALKNKMNEIISTLNSFWNLTSRSSTESNMAIYKSRVSPEMLSNPEQLTDFTAAISGIESGQELQHLLAARTIEERLDIALGTAQKDLLNLEMQIRFLRETDQKTQQRNKEYVLQEQMKQIKKELGSEAERETLAAKFQAKADELNMPEAARKAFDEELSKFRSPESQSYDQNVTRNYLEWLTSLPWGITTKERLSTKNAKDVLDKDHYGLKDVKDRILEFLAVGQLKGSIQGKIICLHGPPGVGKTSIGKSIARATDRKFFRFSLGGLGDYAEIKGHRRTYVAAMPGKAVQALKATQSENPVILLDEVDKVGEGRAHGGDPSAALLEMLDPEQNHNFLDLYLDVPIDLSRVLFVCTANDRSRIPRPLWDRMEAIEVTSYTPAEQFEIAKGYLIPNAIKENGLQGADITMPDEVVKHILEGYIRDSGVRGLQKTLNKVYRKIAYRLVTQYGDVVDEIQPESPEADADKKEQSSERAASTEDQKSSSSKTEEEGVEDHANAETQTKKDAEALAKRLNLPEDFRMVIGEADVHGFLGPPYPNTDRLFPAVMPSGVSNGLAFTNTGAGTLTPIEATLLPGSGQVRLTGHLGQVIQESAQLALSWVKSNAALLGVDPAWMEKQDLHLHMPDGQTPKDGPSAGVALITCLVSLALNKPVSHTLAMTGEASLRGVVLPVGGLKEKLIAAHRNGMKQLILPAAVQPQVETDVAQEIRDALDIHYVHDVYAALNVAFGSGPWTAEAIKLATHRAAVASPADGADQRRPDAASTPTAAAGAREPRGATPASRPPPPPSSP